MYALGQDIFFLRVNSRFNLFKALSHYHIVISSAGFLSASSSQAGSSNLTIGSLKLKSGEKNMRIK